MSKELREALAKLVDAAKRVKASTDARIDTDDRLKQLENKAARLDAMADIYDAASEIPDDFLAALPPADAVEEYSCATCGEVLARGGEIVTPFCKCALSPSLPPADAERPEPVAWREVLGEWIEAIQLLLAPECDLPQVAKDRLAYHTVGLVSRSHRALSPPVASPVAFGALGHHPEMGQRWISGGLIDHYREAGGWSLTPLFTAPPESPRSGQGSSPSVAGDDTSRDVSHSLSGLAGDDREQALHAVQQALRVYETPGLSWDWPTLANGARVVVAILRDAPTPSTDGETKPAGRRPSKGSRLSCGGSGEYSTPCTRHKAGDTCGQDIVKPCPGCEDCTQGETKCKLCQGWRQVHSHDSTHYEGDDCPPCDCTQAGGA